jgi:hypothetical protein
VTLKIRGFWENFESVLSYWKNCTNKFTPLCETRKQVKSHKHTALVYLIEYLRTGSAKEDMIFVTTGVSAKNKICSK